MIEYAMKRVAELERILKNRHHVTLTRVKSLTSYEDVKRALDLLEKMRIMLDNPVWDIAENGELKRKCALELITFYRIEPSRAGQQAANGHISEHKKSQLSIR